MLLYDMSALPWLVPDRYIRSELRRRFTADDGVSFADIHFRLDRGGLCLVEKNKPGPGDPDGIWTVTYELTNEYGTPRQADMRDVAAVGERVYGTTKENDAWMKIWKQRIAQRKADQRLARYKEGGYAIRRAQKASSNWRTTSYGGAPAQLDASKQFMCGHGANVFNDCAICNPDLDRKAFYSNWKGVR